MSHTTQRSVHSAYTPDLELPPPERPPRASRSDRVLRSAWRIAKAVTAVIAAVIAVWGVIVTIVSTLGFVRPDRVAQEAAARARSDSAIVAEFTRRLDEIQADVHDTKEDVKKVKAVILHCEGRALCE